MLGCTRSIFEILKYCLQNGFDSRTVTNRTGWIFTNEAHHLHQGRPWLVAGLISFIVRKNNVNSVQVFTLFKAKIMQVARPASFWKGMALIIT